MSPPDPGTSTAPDLPDPFDLLGLPARFELDAAALHRAYLDRAAAAHPDRPGQRGGTMEGAGNAAALNRARQALADPELRARALLARLQRLQNLRPEPGSDRALPDGFLARMLEVRERMEADRGDPASRDKWSAWAESQRDGHIARIAALFAADPPALAAIGRELNAWRYIERMIEQLDL